MIHSEILSKIDLGMSREQVITILGEPDFYGGVSRKYKTPSIFKYDDIELHFTPYKNGILVTIWDENSEKVIKKI